MLRSRRRALHREKLLPLLSVDVEAIGVSELSFFRFAGVDEVVRIVEPSFVVAALHWPLSFSFKSDPGVLIRVVNEEFGMLVARNTSEHEVFIQGWDVCESVALSASRIVGALDDVFLVPHQC